VVVDNKVLPTSRNQYSQRYYMDISIEFDLLAEDEAEMLLNYSNVKSITKHIISKLDNSTLSKEAGRRQIDFFEEALSEATFEIEFNGFIYSGNYEGYLTQFDAKPDMDKGYYYEREKLKQLYPKAYKVSLKFESTNFIADTGGIYPWRSKKTLKSDGTPSVDLALEEKFVKVAKGRYPAKASAFVLISGIELFIRGEILDKTKLVGYSTLTKQLNEFRTKGTVEELLAWFNSGGESILVKDAAAILRNYTPL
jgi:6-pyruvoyl-tetrahydropterin synthase